mgnify:CR=1 FL=1
MEKLLVLTLSCSFGLLLSLYAGFFVALSLAELCLDTRTLALSLETTKCAVKRLIFLNSDFSHFLFPPFAFGKGK